MVIGTGIVFCAQASQLKMWTSVPQMDVFTTRMSTSSLSTLGTGTSSSQSPSSARFFTTARIVFCTRKKLSSAVLRRNLLSEDFAGCQICRERCWRRVFEFGSELLPLQKFVCVSLRNLWTKFLSVGMMERHARNS